MGKLNKEQFQKRLGKRIRELRDEKGLTQEDFDDGTDYGVTSRAIQAIESGRKDVRSFTLHKIATRLGVEIGDLFGRRT